MDYQIYKKIKFIKTYLFTNLEKLSILKHVHMRIVFGGRYESEE